MAEDPGGLTLEEAARRHGAYLWVERRLFEVTGAWTGREGVPPAWRVHLFEASAQHAWHAELWRERLPVLAGFDAEGVVRPWRPRLDQALGRLEPEPATGPYLELLEGLVLSYRRHLLRLGDVSDAPAIRAATLVVRDEQAQIEAARAITAGSGPGPAGSTGPDLGAWTELFPA